MKNPEKATVLVEKMLDFAQAHGLMEAEDRCYTRNLLLDALGMAAPEGTVGTEPGELPPTLTPILEELTRMAAEAGLVDEGAEAREHFGVRLCGLITPHPQAVRERFEALYRQEGPQAATDWFYQMCRDCDYIKVDHIAKNLLFERDTPAGRLEITINLSKPEKDPRDIAKALTAKQVSYPPCMLCVENPGYAGRPGFPARQNHRVVPIDLAGAPFYLQYSPYLYYGEHCIVFNRVHRPMAIDHDAFCRLFAFVEKFPHYFLGSNADLPIVGGSILSHDHFQGGNHLFPMDRAGVRMELQAPDQRIQAWVADWPMTCVRLVCPEKEPLIQAADDMLAAWRGYSDPELGILAHTDAPHNTITPIVRRQGAQWVMNLVLRNNRTDEEHPLGIFHPHSGLHHIKKENIGLIEVMGLFILPGRLLKEMDLCRDYLTGHRPIEDAPDPEEAVFKHYEWVKELYARAGRPLSREAAWELLQQGIGEKCAQVLADAGVYKADAAGAAGLLRFLSTLGYQRR